MKYRPSSCETCFWRSYKMLPADNINPTQACQEMLCCVLYRNTSILSPVGAPESTTAVAPSCTLDHSTFRTPHGKTSTAQKRHTAQMLRPTACDSEPDQGLHLGLVVLQYPISHPNRRLSCFSIQLPAARLVKYIGQEVLQ